MKEPQRGKIQVTVRKSGGSLEYTIPSGVASLMEIEDGSTLELDIEDKGYGRFMSTWNYEAQMRKYKKQRQDNKENNPEENSDDLMSSGHEDMEKVMRTQKESDKPKL
jgi:antitoxin component of MazEF toxin-antitoxin module